MRHWLLVRICWAYPYLHDELQVPLNHNKSDKSLTINQCGLATDGRPTPIATPMTDLKILRIGCFTGEEL